MSEKAKDKPASAELRADVPAAFDIAAADLPSSPTRRLRVPEPDAGLSLSPLEAPAEASPIFKELAEPKLPKLARADRARLLLQSPTRLYFYWSLADDPFRRLKRLFGDNSANYTLVLKLVELGSEREELHQVDAEGSWWFSVMPDAEYRAELGLYSPSRPYIRILFSNVVETPRRSPSPRSADEARWSVSTPEFAGVLGAAGFTSDAIEAAEASGFTGSGFAREAFAAMIGVDERSLGLVADDELRFVLSSLAAGVPLESLKWRIGAELFDLLQANFAAVRNSEALAPLADAAVTEFDEFEFVHDRAFGSSLINFPKRFRRRRGAPGRYRPVSSSDVR
ncbi:MAG: DUF4912 domain-containing protein [Pyrinomonadaceae bacterium]